MKGSVWSRSARLYFAISTNGFFVIFPSRSPFRASLFFSSSLPVHLYVHSTWLQTILWRMTILLVVIPGQKYRDFALPSAPLCHHAISSFDSPSIIAGSLQPCDVQTDGDLPIQLTTSTDGESGTALFIRVCALYFPIRIGYHILAGRPSSMVKAGR